MAFGAFQYVGDDGTTYQLAQEASYSSGAAGNLPAATGSEPVFPALWEPRHMYCQGFGPATGQIASVICDASNAAFIAGVGSTLLILGSGFTVVDCRGERRPRI